MTGWIRDLALGARLSVGGGRSGWVRLGMISVGVALGVGMLLAATALPSVGAARSTRVVATANGPEVAKPGPDTLLVASVRSQYRDLVVTGRLIQPEGDRAPLPPGVARRLAPGEMVVSPALATLLNSPKGALLRDRWGGRVVGTIAPDGLVGPGDLTFFLGTDTLAGDESGPVKRIRSFGGDRQEPEGLPPLLLVLAVVGLVVLLLPVMIFVTTAVRFGSEARDRQLAAIRLVGADAGMTRRVAAGETLVGTLLGMVLGALLFFATGRQLGDLVPAGLSYFPSDVRPVAALVVAVLIMVPAAAVLVTLSALRKVVIEPLGVVRRTGERRRRLAWRLIPLAAGLAMLLPLIGGIGTGTGGTDFQVAGGVVFLLVGIVLVLPWVIQTSVHRLGGSGVAWQLAIRRLQLDNSTAVRAVAGIVVSVAGIIAVQGLLSAAIAQLNSSNPPATRYQATVLTTSASNGQDWRATLATVPGVRSTNGVALLTGSSGSADATVRVADCDALRQYAKLPSCADGDSFLANEALPEPGQARTLLVNAQNEEPTEWKVPANIRGVSPYNNLFGAAVYLVTPGAFGREVPPSADVLVGLDPGDPDAVERVRNAAIRADPFAFVVLFQDRAISDTLANIQEALLTGAVALLLIIGASLLVNVGEQLRERRRLLAVLAAFGIRRTTLSGSVLFQVAIPVVLGLSLAVATGVGLAAILQSAVDIPISFNWSGIAGVAGAAALMVLTITGASLPLLWRLTRPDGLRTE